MKDVDEFLGPPWSEMGKPCPGKVGLALIAKGFDSDREEPRLELLRGPQIGHRTVRQLDIRGRARMFSSRSLVIGREIAGATGPQARSLRKRGREKSSELRPETF